MRWLRTIRSSLISLLVASAFLAGVELFLRAIDYGAPRNVFRRERDEQGVTWARANRGVFGIERQTGVSLNTAPCRLPKPSDTFRVVSLGASTTYGRPYEHRGSFSFLLQRLFDELPEVAGRGAEVLNAGLPAASSREVLAIGTAALELDPDLLVLYAGHNDFGHHSRTGGLSGGIGRFLEKLEIAELVGDAVWGAAEAPPRTASLEDFESILPSSPAARRVVDRFAGNVGALLDRASRQGVLVLVIAPASNLRSWPPNRTLGSHGLSSDLADRFQRHRDAARGALAAREPTAALAELDAAARLQPDDAQTQFERGLCLDALQRYEEAAQAFRLARDLDALPLRATQPIRRVLRDLARERGLPFLDAEAVLADRTRPHVPGDELFIDNVHPYVQGHALLAEAIYREIVRARLWRGPLPSSTQLDPTRWLSPAEEVQAFLLTGDYLLRFGRAALAERMFRRALERAPDSAEGWIRWGRFLTRMNRRQEAAAAFERAGELDPERRSEIETYRGVLLAPHER